MSILLQNFVGDHIKTFAYLSIDMTEKNFRKCKYIQSLSGNSFFKLLFYNTYIFY